MMMIPVDGFFNTFFCIWDVVVIIIIISLRFKGTMIMLYNVCVRIIKGLMMMMCALD
jgi:hypothetical protein